MPNRKTSFYTYRNEPLVMRFSAEFEWDSDYMAWYMDGDPKLEWVELHGHDITVSEDLAKELADEFGGDGDDYPVNDRW